LTFLLFFKMDRQHRVIAYEIVGHLQSTLEQFAEIVGK